MSDSTINNSIEGNTIKVSTNDGEVFTLEKKIYDTMYVIRQMLDDLEWTEESGPIPLPNVNSTTLKNYIAFVEHKWPDPVTRPYPDENGTVPMLEDDNAPSSDKQDEFLSKLSQEDLFQLILATNFLNYESALHHICAHVASMIRNKPPEEIRKFFNIESEPAAASSTS